MLNFKLTKEFVIVFEGAIIFVGIILCLATTQTQPLEHSENAPNVVTGYVTLAGVLAAFTGFWLTHIF